ncbi:hypothetical protein BDA96_01G297900 [Sorghum bicolor]|uniref:Uncharacterized protein n=1 Tax=Sorghum bicolor TaxID=4558 RepID=A0A921S1Y1_SORBI|nr:hypothetical protein BDA96_01G297900 [Sorghum bicolor]KAG0549949.1 hypothetical protein BDA96_01G297900 [Sorghum bicolor]KAG0549951.1 hypothetical protein BDA96_01G297900 [Sorghum bicolor]
MGCGQARTLGGSFPDALPSPMVADGVFGWLCAWMTDDGVVAAAGMARIHILSCHGFKLFQAMSAEPRTPSPTSPAMSTAPAPLS